MGTKYIIDVDKGVDDAQAIMMALSLTSSAHVIAITCVNGNVTLDKVCRNTLRVLEVCNRLDVPLYRGCTQPLISERIGASHHHGDDGLGDCDWPSTPDMSLIKEEHAVKTMVRLINEHKGEVTLIALAPLTNVATALQLDPDLGRKLKRCVIMGGNIHGKGNISPAAEFNFYADPEAVRLTLHRLTCPIQLVTWEVVHERIQYGWDVFDNLVSVGNKRARLLKEIMSNIMKRHKARNVPFYLCDQSAVAVGLDESINSESQLVFCDVELSGELTRGQIVVDWQNKSGKQPNVELVLKLNLDKLKQFAEGMVQ